MTSETVRPKAIMCLLMLWLTDCGSPLAPGQCRDPEGRGPIPFLSFSCAPSGFDLRCVATLAETGYCATPGTRDVTAMAQWTSSNSSVASFASPGLLRVLIPGEVEIMVAYGYQTAFSRDFTVAPGATAEEMVHLLVIVEDATVPNKRIADASIDVMPERGPAQHCQSSSTGACFFWVFPTAVRVRANKLGYQPSEGIAPAPTGGVSQNVSLKLSPSP